MSPQGPEWRLGPALTCFVCSCCSVPRGSCVPHGLVCKFVWLCEDRQAAEDVPLRAWDFLGISGHFFRFSPAADGLDAGLC